MSYKINIDLIYIPNRLDGTLSHVIVNKTRKNFIVLCKKFIEEFPLEIKEQQQL